jgi:hypothetical protein
MRATVRERADRERTVKTKVAQEEKLVCTICGKPATGKVDGEHSCADHIELVYENQLEDYTREHQGENT